MNNSKFIKFTGLVGIIGPIFGFFAIFISTLLCGAGCGNPVPAPFDDFNGWASDGSFSWRSNALSDMGISKVAYIYNSSIIILGILTLIFYVGFIWAYAKSKLFYIGGALLICASVSVSLLGVFTEAYATPHLILAMVNFGLGPLGVLLVGLAFIRMNFKTKGYLSLLIGIIDLLVFLIPWNVWRSVGLGFAVPQVVVSLVTSVWIVWMSVGLIRNVCIQS
jgi:hypothetical membrane protein